MQFRKSPTLIEVFENDQGLGISFPEDLERKYMLHGLFAPLKRNASHILKFLAGFVRKFGIDVPPEVEMNFVLHKDSYMFIRYEPSIILMESLRFIYLISGFFEPFPKQSTLESLKPIEDIMDLKTVEEAYDYLVLVYFSMECSKHN